MVATADYFMLKYTEELMLSPYQSKATDRTKQ